MEEDALVQAGGDGAWDNLALIRAGEDGCEDERALVRAGGVDDKPKDKHALIQAGGNGAVDNLALVQAGEDGDGLNTLSSGLRAGATGLRRWDDYWLDSFSGTLRKP